MSLSSPLSAFDKLWNWKANYSHIFTQIGTALGKLCESKWMRSNSFAKLEQDACGRVKEVIFVRITLPSLDICFHLGLTLSQLSVKGFWLALTFLEVLPAGNTIWQFCYLLSLTLIFMLWMLNCWQITFQGWLKAMLFGQWMVMNVDGSAHTGDITPCTGGMCHLPCCTL